MSAGGERLALAAFVTQAVLAGGNAVGVRFSNRELEPLWGAALRFMLAAALMVALMAAMRLDLPRGRAFTGSVLYGLFNFGLPFALIYYGLVHVHAGLGQVLLSLVPLATLLLAVLWRQEQVRAAALLGTALALAGVALMTRGPIREAAPLLSVLALVGASFCFAQALVLVRRFPRVHPVAMNGVGMSAGAVVLLAAAAVSRDSFALPQDTQTWLAIAYLVVFGSVGVFLLLLYVLGRWPATRTAYAFVLIPFVTVLLSAWLDDEPVTVGLVLGGLLVLAGVYVGALRRAT